MAARRRQFRETEVLAVLLMQGAIIPCKRCRIALILEDVKAGNVQKEHLHELSLGGADESHNCAYSHTECHAVITNGNGATTAGSSTNRRAKANNPGRTEKFVVQKPDLGPNPAYCLGCESEVDTRIPHICPNRKPRHRPAIINPGEKCRRCGEWGEDCRCQAPMRKASFGGRR